MTKKRDRDFILGGDFNGVTGGVVTEEGTIKWWKAKFGLCDVHEKLTLMIGPSLCSTYCTTDCTTEEGSDESTKSTYLNLVSDYLIDSSPKNTSYNRHWDPTT